MHVSVLITTKDRIDLLLHRSLKSVLRQSFVPREIVIVNDGTSVSEVKAAIDNYDTNKNIPIVILQNHRMPGAGGALNTGLEYIKEKGGCDFVAMLDDDDEWDPTHLEENLKCASQANVVISGLRMMRGGMLYPRPLIQHLSSVEFLCGNPGWQGSNTFVRMELLLSVGGFREGLPSLNDRDLALRLLSHSRVKVKYTNCWTATWYSDTPGNLSTPNSQSKSEGLRMFWHLYKDRMTLQMRTRFLHRAEHLFHISANHILDIPPTRIPKLGFCTQENA